jgi:hypothetical protein
MNRHLRNAVVAATAITAGLLMTACQNGSDADSAGKSGTGATAVADKASDSKGSKGSHGSQGTEGTQDSRNSKGVSGSFTDGKVTYLAPGKYIVSVPGKGDQQFLVADDTEVYGAGTICGEAAAKVDAPCTLDQLEAAAKKDAVSADVKMKNGIATLVTERHGKGVDGTWFGNVSYLAPGKYTVSDMKGVEQQFFIAEDTEIRGYDDICDAVNTGAGGEGGTECTEAELEEAAKKGFSAEVVISNGIATSIRDDH